MPALAKSKLKSLINERLSELQASIDMSADGLARLVEKSLFPEFLTVHDLSRITDIVSDERHF